MIEEKNNTDKTEQEQSRYRGLKPFKKGQSGNPDGRPKGSISIIAEIKKQLDEMPEGEKKNNLKIIVSKMIEMAKRGNDKMIRNILNYVEGMPKQSVSLGADETIGGVKIEIIKNKEEKKDENSKPEINNSI